MSDSLNVPTEPLVIDLRETPDPRVLEHKGDALVFTAEGWVWKSMAMSGTTPSRQRTQDAGSGSLAASDIFSEEF